MSNPLLSTLPEPALSIAQKVAGLKATKDGYLADLYMDASTGTQPDYSLDGRTVNRNAWREGLFNRIKQIDELINALQPYQKKSVAG